MAQFYPGDNATVVETFSDSVWPYGVSPSMYVRAIPYIQQFHDQRGGGSTFDISHDTGNLIDVVPGEAISHPATPATARPASCFLARETFLVNARVELEADLYHVSGPIADEHSNAGFFGVWARMHEGSKVNSAGTVDEYLGDDVAQGTGTQSFKGYGFYAVGDQGNGVRYAIVKLRTDDTNGPEVLASRTEAQWNPYATGDPTNSKWGPAGMALEIGTVFGGDVLMIAYMRDMKNGGAWVQLMNATDASSPFVVGGRCGFSLSQIGTNGAGSPMIGGAKAQAFQIEELL